jgi:hypothetical protein
MVAAKASSMSRGKDQNATGLQYYLQRLAANAIAKLPARPPRAQPDAHPVYLTLRLSKGSDGFDPDFPAKAGGRCTYQVDDEVCQLWVLPAVASNAPPTPEQRPAKVETEANISELGEDLDATLDSQSYNRQWVPVPAKASGRCYCQVADEASYGSYPLQRPCRRCACQVTDEASYGYYPLQRPCRRYTCQVGEEASYGYYPRQRPCRRRGRRVADEVRILTERGC